MSLSAYNPVSGANFLSDDEEGSLKTLSSDDRSPTYTDYIAGVILTNGLAVMSLNVAVYVTSLSGLLLPFWVFGSAAASYLVSSRTTRGHLMVGVKTAVASTIVGILMIPAFTGAELDAVVPVLACYLVGGVLGAYLALRDRMRSLRAVSARARAQP
jgi:hypothetical protein